MGRVTTGGTIGDVLKRTGQDLPRLAMTLADLQYRKEQQERQGTLDTQNLEHQGVMEQQGQERNDLAAQGAKIAQQNADLRFAQAQKQMLGAMGGQPQETQQFENEKDYNLYLRLNRPDQYWSDKEREASIKRGAGKTTKPASVVPDIEKFRGQEAEIEKNIQNYLGGPNVTSVDAQGQPIPVYREDSPLQAIDDYGQPRWKEEPPTLENYLGRQAADTSIFLRQTAGQPPEAKTRYGEALSEAMPGMEPWIREYLYGEEPEPTQPTRQEIGREQAGTDARSAVEWQRGQQGPTPLAPAWQDWGFNSKEEAIADLEASYKAGEIPKIQYEQYLKMLGVQ